MKRLISCILCVIMIVSLAVPAAAALEYTYIDTIASGIDYNALWGIANCSATVDSMDDYEMELEVTLQEYNENTGIWNSLKTWSERGIYHVHVEESYAVSRTKEHRLFVAAYVYDSNGRIIDSGTQISY